MTKDFDQTIRLTEDPAQAVDVFISHSDRDHFLLAEMLRHLREANKIAEEMNAPLTPEPPTIAEFLLTALLKPSRADAATGDLNERFARECVEFGHRRASRLYWARTWESLWPLLRRAIGKAMKWGVVIATVRRLF